MKCQLVAKLSSLKLGSHCIMIEREKWKPESVRVAGCSRFCLCSRSAVVDDEYHESSSFEVQREQYPVCKGHEGMSVGFNHRSGGSNLARCMDSALPWRPALGRLLKS
jgi:hypothetical protein